MPSDHREAYRQEAANQKEDPGISILKGGAQRVHVVVPPLGNRIFSLLFAETAVGSLGGG